MLISIVTPAHNAEAYLPATLASINAQSHTNWELIVVDDGSADRTPEVVRSWAKMDSRVKLHQQANAGVAEARNAGYRMISPESQFVIFLDADDVWRPRCLEKLAQAIESDSSAPAVHGRAECIDAQGRAIPMLGYEGLGRQYVRAGRIETLADDQPTHFASIALRDPITTPGQVLIRRSALEAVGLYDGRASPAEDWDLWLRLAFEAPLRYLPETVLDYRRHSGNASGQLSRMRRGELYVRRKAITLATARPSLRAIAKASWRHTELERCVDRLRRADQFRREQRLGAALGELARASRSIAAYCSTYMP